MPLEPEQGDSSLSSSPHYSPISDIIHEESDECDSEQTNEPVTPVSGRQSREFQTRRSIDYNCDHDITPIATEHSLSPFSSAQQQEPGATPKGAPLILNTVATPPQSSNTCTRVPSSPSGTSEDETQRVPLQTQQRSTRGSQSSTTFVRRLSNVFSRKNSTTSNLQPAMGQSNHYSNASESNFQGTAPNRRWSMNRSSATTPRSSTPPSPGEPIPETKQKTANPRSNPDDIKFVSKKSRASTGLASRAINFATGNGKKEKKDDRRRASSVDHGDKHKRDASKGRQVLYMAADTGVGVKARRLSLSLPDEFAVDVIELTGEFEYQHKFLGRHRDQLGKGATAKVKVMARKGCPGELYAVKEFRGKSSSETKEEYEKKVKSEFSIAKSLHHPNIVETIRLCTDHGRWNHVMEYCSEGDLFSLVKQNYLKREDRAGDRLCLFKQLVQGLNYLHSNGIAHRDIKLENLLITKESKLKITDFGVSEVFSGIHPGVREAGGECGRDMGALRLCAPGVCGSEPYIAPEVLAKDRHYDARALDVWSAAVVMINLLVGAGLWAKAQVGAPNSEQYAELVKGWNKWNVKHPDPDARMTETDYPHYMVFDTYFNPPPLRRVLLSMLNPNPDKRATIVEVLNNRWVKGIECCQLETYDDPALLIDATKKSCFSGTKKIYCHSHLPPKSLGTHSLGKMPGQAGY